MKFLSEKEALKRLNKIKSAYRSIIQKNYEHRAKNCLTCETQGACCLDAHFVNVHISRLEAVAISQKIKEFPAEKQREISQKISATIEKYNLTKNDFSKTFACPLFEKGTGCLVHSVKPVPCLQHACYERKEDLPPDELQFETEAKIEKLNQQTYKKNALWLSLPIYLNLLKRD